VWDYPDTAGSADLVRVHIKNLREAIEADPQEPAFIKTIKGYGYTIQQDETQSELPQSPKKIKARRLS
jgi:two-component system alkaline phosphatase synthesis response regulator PhoP